MIDIKPYERNGKRHNKEQLYKIACSLRDFGWRQSIVVDSEGVIIVGHGRWFAYERYKGEMNLAEPRVEVANDLSPEKVKAYRLVDNMIVSTEYDMDVVNSELQQLGLGLEPWQAMLQFDVVEETTKGKDERFINDEGLEAYLNNTIRQCVLHYQQDEFTALIAKCEDLYTRFSVENASELFKLLVEREHETPGSV